MTEEKQFNDELEQNPSEEQKVTDENPAPAEDQLIEEPVDVAETHEEPQEITAQEVVPESPVAEQPVIEEPVIEEPVSEEPVLAEEPAPVSETVKTPEPPEFDWELSSKKHESYSKAERERLEDIYGKTLSSINEHEVILGTVVAISSREVVVNIGFKSDGVIPLNEVRYNPNLKIGDEIEVYVESQEDTTGQLMLSHRKARTLRSWERVNTAFETDEIIKGYVKSRTKGGLIVDVFGIEAFLPGSQIDVKPIRDYDVYVDKVMEFKVVKINHEYKNVVVSHKALIEDELEQQRSEIIAKLEKGQVLEGLVKNITSYGVFVDMGGVDGLIHITDLSWGRINHPNEVVELDQKIKVAILDFDESKKRIALGLKQLTPHPWDSLDPDLKVGDKVEGRVVVLADYGAFVEIAPGVEGLIHVSEMSWSQHLRTAQDFMKVDDKVEAVILTLSREERKMSLGIKQLIPDPWENILAKYPINSKHKALVRNFTNFGIFVELEEGVDGLIHISDLSWSKKIKHPAEFTKVGEELEVIVLDVDVENRRLSLGHKQLEENPWDVFETVFTPGSVHKGTIQGQADKGMIITLPYGVEGFAPLRHLVKEDNTTAKVDETLDFKVIEFSKENKKIILSHSKVYQDAQAAERSKEKAEALTEEEATRRTVRRMQDSLEKTTLGDITALAKMKSDLEKSEKAERKSKAASKSKKDEEEAESQVEEGTDA
ncbi:MAG: 30S ribosomal protein S1 [Bacteroidales bacterium]